MHQVSWEAEPCLKRRVLTATRKTVFLLASRHSLISKWKFCLMMLVLLPFLIWKSKLDDNGTRPIFLSKLILMSFPHLPPASIPLVAMIFLCWKSFVCRNWATSVWDSETVPLLVADSSKQWFPVPPVAPRYSTFLWLVSIWYSCHLWYNSAIH